MNTFYDILNKNTISKFIVSNKHDEDLIQQFIVFVKINKSYKSLMSMITTFIEIKSYMDEIPHLLYLLIKEIKVNATKNENIPCENDSIEKSNELKNETDIDEIYSNLQKKEFIVWASNISSSLINKFKGNEILPEIISSFIDLIDLDSMCFEEFLILSLVSRFINITNTFPSKHNFCKYLDFLSKIFLKSHYYYSYINCIININKISQSKIQINGNYFDYCEIKNEGQQFSYLMCKLPYYDINDYKDLIKNINDKKNSNIEMEKLSFNNTEEIFNFLVNNKILLYNKTVEKFLKINNIGYKIEKGYIIVDKYKYKSNISKIFDIINLYSLKQNKSNIKTNKVIGNSKDLGSEKIIKNKNKKEIKTQQKTFSDNFKVNKAKFNIYCDILKSNYKLPFLNLYKERNENRKINYYKHLLSLKNIKQEMEKYKNIVDKLQIILCEKKKAAEKIEGSKIIKSKSWRDLDNVRNNNFLNVKAVEKIEYKSNRNVYTYKDGVMNEDILVEKSEANFSTGNIYAYNLANIKNMNSFDQNLYKPDFSNMINNDNKSNILNTNIYKPGFSTLNIGTYKPTSINNFDNNNIYKPDLNILKANTYKPTLNNVNNDNIYKPDLNISNTVTYKSTLNAVNSDNIYKPDLNSSIKKDSEESDKNNKDNNITKQSINKNSWRK